MTADYDYLIVGQGVAGTSLAWHLLEKNLKFLIIDSPHTPSSSRVAAGIFNPLTGRKLVKTWLADTLFPYATAFYSKAEQQLGTQFLHHTEIYRPYRNESEKTNYLKWTDSPDYEHYVPDHQPDYTGNKFVNAPINGLSISQSGWLDLPHFLDSSRNYFEQMGCFREAFFSSDEISFEVDLIRWNQMSFGKVINCMGVGAEKDRFFGWLPFNPVKGQILDCRIEGYDIREIVNQGIFMLPVKRDIVRVGATYSWHDLDWNITQDAVDYLSEKLSALLKVPFDIIGQLAGIRPSSKDRRPFIGRHPDIPQLYIFNGLGTKGVTLAPFFARQLTDFFLSDEELHPEANIDRYFSLYSKPRMS